jgi:ABC-type multidrug transport system ATPase subunit
MAAPAPLPGLYLRWENVVYDVSLPRDTVVSPHTAGAAHDGVPPLTKRVLHRVSGQLLPGGLLAVMGPSGSGKTSLIKILAGRRAPTSGALLVNGVPLSPVPFRNASGFVAQHTVFLDTLTVRRLACALRDARFVCTCALTTRAACRSDF